MPAAKEQINSRVVVCGRNPSGDPVGLAVDADGQLLGGAATQVSADATLSSVNSSASSAQVLAANAARRMVIAQNDDANDCYLKYGATATTSDYTVRIPGNGGYWEMPEPIYSGRIDAIWSADGGGALRVTEIA
jgi:hypothetical protein